MTHLNEVRNYDPVILCVCRMSIHDNPSARAGHEGNWHSAAHPASYSAPVAWKV